MKRKTKLTKEIVVVRLGLITAYAGKLLKRRLGWASTKAIRH